MANTKDYYSILGVDKKSTQDEIKQAYRKLAREHHPDMVKDGDKSTAETRFKEINEAYQILSDPQKRQMYDQYGNAAFSGGQGQQGGFGSAQGGQWGPFSYTYSTGAGANPGFGDFDPMDVFEEFFGFRGFGGNRAPRKGKNLYYELQVSFIDAVKGLEKEITIESGKMKIKIPSGVRDGTELRFEGKGMAGPQGIPNGDVFITIRVLQPREFKVVGDDILVTKEISFVQAILGADVDIAVVDYVSPMAISQTKLKIPSGTQHGSRFVVRGKGMPRLRGKGQGDAYIDVFVKIPNRISKKQKELLEEYQKVL